MASSPSSTTNSDSTPAEEPVIQDSLAYWEKQSATYDGVLGV
jgi:hypothetical protein